MLDVRWKLDLSVGYWILKLNPRRSDLRPLSYSFSNDPCIKCLSYCTVLFMRTLGDILGTAARTEILRALYYQPEPVGLRYLGRIAGVYPHSAELALKALVKEELVHCDRCGTRTLYVLNSNHADIDVLEAVFRASERVIIERNNHGLSERARLVLPFIESASRMIAHAKGAMNVT